MKKTICMLVIILTPLWVWGCQPTPDENIVAPKDIKKIVMASQENENSDDRIQLPDNSQTLELFNDRNLSANRAL